MFPLKDLLRPFFGLILIQPIVVIWLFLTRDNPFEEYISVGWGLQLLITLWLIPIYFYYEMIWTYYYGHIELYDLADPKKSN